MTKQEIEEKLGTGQFWSNKDNKWINSSDLELLNNFIAYGDDGGDTFIKEAKDKEDLKNKLKKHIDGATGCDFETEVFLIVENGIKRKPSYFLA